MNEREALKLALEALEWNYNTDLDNIHACEKWAKMLKENIAAIREALSVSSTECEKISHPLASSVATNDTSQERVDETAKQRHEAQLEQDEKFCDSNCVWTDHHPDCKLAQPDYRAMYLKVRDELAELQQRSEK